MRVFLFVVLTVLFLGFYYVGSRLISSTSLGWERKRLLWVFWGACLVLQIAAPFIYRMDVMTPISNTQKYFQTFSYAVLGFASLLVFGAFLIDLIHLISRGGSFSEDRRQFLVDGFASIVAAFSGGASAYGVATVRGAPPVENVSIAVDGLSSDLKGFRVVQMTDLHIGPTLPASYLKDCVDKVNELNADIVAITGDMVDATVEQIKHEIAVLAQLKSRYGVYFVTGNHEYYWDAAAWTKHIRTLGINVLDNAGVRISHNGKVIGLGGVNDISAGRFGVTSEPAMAMSALGQCDFTMLLAHQPNSCVDASKAGFQLQLSGHTHGGQYYPFRFFVKMAQKYLAGLYKVENLWLYVSRGTSYWGPPLRMGVPREITVIELA